MDIVVALDGALERNLIFPPGDDLTLNLTVYAHDGDTTPLTVTNPQLSTGGGALFPIGSQFTVSCIGRTPYRLAVDIDGVTTTVAYGYIESPYSYSYCWSCCLCYDGCIFPPVIPTTMATNVRVSDFAEYFVADNVEDVLQEVGLALASEENEWVSYTPTVAPESGLMNVLVNGLPASTPIPVPGAVQYKVVGQDVLVRYDFTVTAKGTGDGYFGFTLPFGAINTGGITYFAGHGCDVATDWKSHSVMLAGGAALSKILRFDATSPIADGARLVGQLSFRKT